MAMGDVPFHLKFATIAQSRQFLDGLCTVVQGEFSAGIALPFTGDAFVFLFKFYFMSYLPL